MSKLAPLSKYIIVSYHPNGYWMFEKTQYLDTLEKARDQIKWIEEYSDDVEPNYTTLKIFELKEVV